MKVIKSDTKVSHRLVIVAEVECSVADSRHIAALAYARLPEGDHRLIDTYTEIRKMDEWMREELSVEN